MNRYANMIFVVIISLFSAAAAIAAEYSDLYVIPIAGHAPGANGTAWRSDVVIHNPQTVPITVEMALVDSGLPAAEPIAITFGGEASLQLAAGETRTLPDVLAEIGRDVTGTLIVGATLPVVLTSRTWAEVPGGRTLGQTVQPIAITASADALNDRAVLAGLAQGVRQRSNVGLFAAVSAVPFAAEIEIVSASGERKGAQLVRVDAEGFVHRQYSSAAIAGGVDGATAIVRVLKGTESSCRTLRSSTT